MTATATVSRKKFNIQAAGTGCCAKINNATVITRFKRIRNLVASFMACFSFQLLQQIVYLNAFLFNAREMSFFV
jgi:hypothetical protein